jgi:DNA-binding LytR/AlgR family response regulator
MIRCLLVDDEPLAHTVLESHLEKLNDVQKVGNCFDATSAISFLREHEVDVVFLDIQMPDLTGIELLQTLNHVPLVVFVTAYSEFAIESYEFAAVDYLLKPVRYARFLKAMEKVRERLGKNEKPAKNVQKDSFLSIQDAGVLHRVNLKDITHIQSWGNYVRIFYNNQMKLDRRTLSDLENELNEFGFIRVHKSYIVNVNYVQKMDGNKLIGETFELPIGESYKQQTKVVLFQT